jgi:hypothetical protein
MRPAIESNRVLLLLMIDRRLRRQMDRLCRKLAILSREDLVAMLVDERFSPGGHTR